MKVLNLSCADGHAFEGWFASEDDFIRQRDASMLSCPVCGSPTVHRLPSAPRLNLSHAKGDAEPAAPRPAAEGTGAAPAQALQAAWLHAVQQVVANTEDVGERFPEEVRRIHYGEADARGIRGQASPEQRAALQDEGIEVFSLPIPKGLDGPTH